MEQFGYANESNIENIKNNGTTVEGKSTYTENVSDTGTYTNTTVNTFEKYLSSSIGGICGGSNNTNISICTNNAILIGDIDGFSIGGVVGDIRSNKTVKLSSCTNTGDISTQMACTAGIAGTTYGHVSVESCINNGIINSTNENIAGIIGCQIGGSIKDCNNKNNVTGNFLVGGIVGQSLNIETSTYSLIENCNNEKTSTITSTGRRTSMGYYQQGIANNYDTFFLGGIVGFGDRLTISQCSNFGTIVAQDTSVSTIVSLGGISGEIRDSIVTKCYNKGIVQYNSSAFCVGGIVGVAYYNCYINNCYNTEEISGAQAVGGIVGYGEQANIRYCYNRGPVKGTNEIGGVAASLRPHEVESYTNNYLYYCYNTGTITGTTNTGTVNGRIDYYDVDYIYSIGTAIQEQWSEVGIYKNATNQKMYSDTNSLITAMLGHFSENFTSDYTGTESINGGYPILK